MRHNRELVHPPPYPLTSVDHALRLVQILRDSGEVRVLDAAEELGVAPSTAHRLLAMLVYRGFATRTDSRQYAPGPALSAFPSHNPQAKSVRKIARPHMEWAVGEVGETISLLIRTGRRGRILDTVESTREVRIKDRAGMVLDAHRASGGKAMLASLDEPSVERLYRSDIAMLSGDRLSEREYNELQRELRVVRATGFALNLEGTEPGLHAIAAAIHDTMGTAVAALSFAIPAVRADRLFEPGLRERLMRAVRGVEDDLAALRLGPGNAIEDTA